MRRRKSSLREKVRALCQDRPGVYRFFAGEELIYIGRSRTLRRRLLSYFRAKRGEKAHQIVSAADRVEWEYTPSEFESHLRELYLIQKEKPRFNSAFTHEEDYVFIHVGEGPAPRLMVKREPSDYGPFRSFRRTEEAVRRLSDALQLRTSPDHTPLFELDAEAPGPERRPRCLRGQIGLCMAPCAGRVRFSTYQERLEAALRFLEGKEKDVLENMRARMKEAAKQLAFERAALLRDRLAELERLQGILLSLKASLDALTFVYAVSGEEADQDLWYLIHGGRVIARLPRSVCAEEGEAAMVQAQRLFLPVPRPAGAGEMDEIHIVASWFRTHPEELRYTARPKDFCQKPYRWPRG